MSCGASVAMEVSCRCFPSSLAAIFPSGYYLSNQGEFSTSQQKDFSTKIWKSSRIIRFAACYQAPCCTLGQTLDSREGHMNKLFASSETPVQKRKRGQVVVTGAIPIVALSAAAAALAVGAASLSLLRMHRTKLDIAQSTRKQCEACNGSGLCSSCNGQGFVQKNMSMEAAAMARKNAETAATRFTAGLAKKWKYCANCTGSRGCPVCQSRGWIV
eukprot:c21254_g1_i1 orf=159-803(+)